MLGRSAARRGRARSTGCRRSSRRSTPRPARARTGRPNSLSQTRSRCRAAARSRCRSPDEERADQRIEEAAGLALREPDLRGGRRAGPGGRTGSPGRACRGRSPPRSRRRAGPGTSRSPGRCGPQAPGAGRLRGAVLRGGSAGFVVGAPILMRGPRTSSSAAWRPSRRARASPPRKQHRREREQRRRRRRRGQPSAFVMIVAASGREGSTRKISPSSGVRREADRPRRPSRA